MVLKVYPTSGIVAGAQNMEGAGAGDWKNLLADNLPLPKINPQAMPRIKPIARRDMDVLVRWSDTKQGKETIIDLVRKGGVNLGKEDVETLWHAIIEKNIDADQVLVMRLIRYTDEVPYLLENDCKFLEAVAGTLEKRPDLVETAKMFADAIEEKMKSNELGVILSREDTERLCKALGMLGIPEMWDVLLENMKRLSGSKVIGERTVILDDQRRELATLRQSSWNSSAQAALENGAPFEFVSYAAENGGMKLWIECLWAARGFDPEKQQEIVEKINSSAVRETLRISVEKIRMLSAVPEGMQTDYLWSCLGERFDDMLKTNSAGIHIDAKEMLPLIPGKRRARFIKSALESSAIPIGAAISALAGMGKEFQTDELWGIACTEFAALASSNDIGRRILARKARAAIPDERKEEFLYKAGLKHMSSVGGWRSWGVFNLFREEGRA